MKLPDRSIITYDGLPIKAGGAHRLRLKDPLATWDYIESFLINCTNYSFPETICLQIIKTSESNSLIANAEDIFGKFESIRTIGDYKAYCWPLAKSDIEQSIKFVNLKYEPLPHDIPLINLGIFVRFKFINFQTREILNHQNREEYLNFQPYYNRYLGESSLYTTLSYGRNSLNVFFNFPFEQVNQIMLDYLNQIQKCLPFQFSKQHWKHWKLNKERTSYYGRKIAVIT